MKFRVFTTQEFDKDFEKFDEGTKRNIKKIVDQLKEQGDVVGKPLGHRYFREKKFGDNRLYYLVYKQLILIVAIGNKKMQQETIDSVLAELDTYWHLMRNILDAL